jgi:hypothetical protein
MGETYMPRYHVKAVWDDEASVWVATSDDVPGLVTEADTIPALAKKLQMLIPELLDANNVPLNDSPEIPFELNATIIERTRRAAR